MRGHPSHGVLQLGQPAHARFPRVPKRQIHQARARTTVRADIEDPTVIPVCFEWIPLKAVGSSSPRGVPQADYGTAGHPIYTWHTLCRITFVLAWMGNVPRGSAETDPGRTADDGVPRSVVRPQIP